MRVIQHSDLNSHYAAEEMMLYPFHQWKDIVIYSWTENRNDIVFVMDDFFDELYSFLAFFMVLVLCVANLLMCVQHKRREVADKKQA